MKSILILLLVTIGLIPCSAKVVTLTNTEGRSLQAEIVSYESSKVSIKREGDGKAFKIEYSSLDTASQKLVNTWKQEKDRVPQLELLVTTFTGNKNNAGTNNLRVFVRINGESKRHQLDDPEKNDFEAGAKDDFKGIFLELRHEDIEFIELEVEGDDAWYLERIQFRVIGDDIATGVADFKRSGWMSGVEENVKTRKKHKFMIGNRFDT